MNVIQQPTPLIELVDVHKAFGASDVLKGVSMTIRKGQTACIIGPSGSGKSTILRCMNGLIPVDRGMIRIGAFAVERLKRDRDLGPLRHQMSMVFQQYNLFPHRTVLENIMMALLQVLGHPRAEVRRTRARTARARASDRQGSGVSGAVVGRPAAARCDRARWRCSRP